MAHYVTLEYQSKQNEKKNYIHKYLQANAECDQRSLITHVAKLGEITGKTRVLYSEFGEITGKTRVLPGGI